MLLLNAETQRAPERGRENVIIAPEDLRHSQGECRMIGRALADRAAPTWSPAARNLVAPTPPTSKEPEDGR